MVSKNISDLLFRKAEHENGDELLKETSFGVIGCDMVLDPMRSTNFSMKT
jgi:hypothetical protein